MNLNRNIFIVENNPLFSPKIKEILGPDYEVHRFETTLEAIHKIGEGLVPGMFFFDPNHSSIFGTYELLDFFTRFEIETTLVLWVNCKIGFVQTLPKEFNERDLKRLVKAAEKKQNEESIC